MALFEDVPGRLFPPFARGVLAPTGPDCDRAPAEEREAVAGAGPARRREFLCGRACAHAALAAIGRDAGPIGVGRGRQPLWPPGAVGSISHAGDWAGAVVARTEDAWAIGFDMEVLDPPLTPDVERLVLTEQERSPGSLDDQPAPHRSKVAFSAKECVYKCLFPATGWTLDFGDVTVDVDVAAGRFAARLAARFRHRGLDGTVLHGRLVVDHGYVFTGLCIPREQDLARLTG